MPKKCAHCGGLIPEGKRADARYCSALCNGRAYKAANRERVRAGGREYHAVNRERINARQRKYRAANLESVRARDREYRAANLERISAQGRKYLAANLAAAKVRARERIARLSTVYVVSKLQIAHPGLKRADIPPEIIEAKRKLIEAKRLLKGRA